ncbi:MptD family putative ECF transporter S component [Streptococcus pseudopneumoniae]|uniref:MptD family putative ECF transporter S component n=1 Tax=Streptococcus pseudopneumoniae TaxID=257758 RepID=UPI00141A22D2|nr:MptD family putative ECF transporter S component [Streptococcus pseudopneumoniae]NIB66651.1 Trep_Strep domain-containing protein [Streptococcus pseudopneumoniae]
MKKTILTTLLFAVLYFLCMGIGVLLGNPLDQTGNMFYAPAFTALVGGSVYMILVAKVPRFGAITTIGLVMALFFLGSKHGAGAFLPGIICGLLADGIAHLGKYKDQTKNFLSFILFAFSTSGPILLMWITPKAYMATLLARGKSQEYIDRIMVAPNPGTILLFVASVVIGALVGALIGQVLSKKLAQKVITTRENGWLVHRL